MANIIVPSRRIWTRPPQQAVHLLPEYSGGSVLLASGGGLFNVVDTGPVALPANLTPTIKYGLACVTNVSTSANAVTIPRGLAGNNWAAIFVGSLIAGSSGYDTFCQTNNGLLLKFGNSYTGDNKFGVVIPGVANYTSNISAISGVPFVAIFTGTNGGAYDLVVRWLDTKQVNVATGVAIGSAASTAGSSYLLSESTAPYGPGAGSSIAMAGFFGRRMPLAEALFISQNPWQIFRPQVRRSFFDMGAGGGSTLAIAKIFQSHALDGLTLTAQSDLAVTDANHGNAIGAIGLSASSLLAVGDASHDHLAENVALNTTGSENLIVLDSLHSHVADGVALTTQWLISVADALNSQSLESLTLSLDSHLAVADAGHGHASESMTLGVAGADNLVVSDVLHGQTAEGLALVTEWLLIVTDAAHAQLAESTILSTDALLVVQEASNDHLAENVALDTSDATTLATQGGVQWHTADGITLTLDTWLAIVGAAHAHAADAPTLSTEAALQIAEALHAHYADTVVLSFPGVTTLTPDDISAIAAAVLASLQATTIPVDAVTGAWPTAVENADALLSRTWP